jgi:membrane protein DedA with SNARE-associated domain
MTMHDLLAWIAAAFQDLLDYAKAHPEQAFAVAFIMSFGESFAGLSFFVPGTTVLIAIGALLRAVDAGPYDIAAVWLAAAVGAILGDWISYWIGHRYKEHVLATWPVSRYRGQMDRALAFFAHRGVWAIFIGRFLGPFRATVPLVAGISQMRFWPFQIANVSSALVWSASLLLLGAVGWTAIKSALHWLGGWPSLAVLALLLLIAFVFRGRIGALLRTMTPK